MGLRGRDHRRNHDESSNYRRHGCDECTLRYHLARPGTKRRMRRILGMMMGLRRHDGHRGAAGSKHNQP
jgi:hypothetical protein